MRWILGAVVAAGMCSTAIAGHFHFGGGFGGYGGYGPGFGMGFGVGRYYGPSYSSFSIGGPGIFGAARLNLYNGGYGYRSFGYSNVIVPYPGPIYTPSPYAYGAPSYYYGPVYSYVPAYPNLSPFNSGPSILPNRVAPLQPQVLDFNGNPQPQPQPGLGQDWEPAEPAEPIVRVSNAEMRRRSLRLQAFGDEWMARKEWGQALQRYREASTIASDLSAPRIRMAVAYCAMGHPDLAIREIKRSLKLDPTLPTTSDRLATLFGGQPGEAAMNSVLLRVGDWVQQDIRDPDRLLVLGTLLFLNDDPDQAMPFLKTSAQLSGSVAYLDPFLKKAQVIQPAGGEAPPPPPEEAGPAVIQKIQPRKAPQPAAVPAPAGDNPRIIEFPKLPAPSPAAPPAETPDELPPLPETP